jgi:hypothetical protein
MLFLVIGGFTTPKYRNVPFFQRDHAAISRPNLHKGVILPLD